MDKSITRRRFIGSSSMALAALTLDVQLPAQGSMFISQNGAVAPRTSWPEAAHLAASVGYGGIDWNLSAAKKSGLEATRTLFSGLKLRPTICGAPMNLNTALGPENAFREALPLLAEDAAFSAEVGGHDMMMVMSPVSTQPREERRKLAVDRFAAISEVLAKSNVRLGLEFLGPLYFRTRPIGGRGGQLPATPIPFIWTLTDTVALGRDAGPQIGVVLDIWHWYHSGGTVADILATDRNRIVHVHLSDARQMPPEDVRDDMRLMPGEGQIDVTGFLQALHKIGYVGGVAPEPLGRIPQEMPAEDASKLGFTTTLASMKRAGVI